MSVHNWKWEKRRPKKHKKEMYERQSDKRKKKDKNTRIVSEQEE